jgi:osmotically-inducible protein OsmY
MTHELAPFVPMEQLESRLSNCAGRQIRNLRVVVHSGGLVLRGRSATYYAKQIVQHAAMEFTGLPVLANEIEVYSFTQPKVLSWKSVSCDCRWCWACCSVCWQ